MTYLKNQVIACLFYEPSTRTSCSFQAAILKLSGSVITSNENVSSAMKGESLEDTIRCLACYCNAIILRHPTPGASLKAAAVAPSDISIINAGDGIGEHPTQALLDFYTILREIQEQRRLDNNFLNTNHNTILSGKSILFLGDLKHSRTVHSLAKLLGLFNVRLIYVSAASLRMPDEIIRFVQNIGKAHQCGFSNILDVIDQADALYVTRVQKERFSDPQEYEHHKGSYVITPELMAKAKSTCTVLHPLPRVDEIDTRFDDDPRAAYFRQMKNGMFVRMALLRLLCS